jgi:hypothetical protein
MREHVMKRPDTYVGSTTKSAAEVWVWEQDAVQQDGVMGAGAIGVSSIHVFLCLFLSRSLAQSLSLRAGASTLTMS